MHPDIQRGDLLIASASLRDPNFERSVILVCDHSDADGTYGLVLNRPLPVPKELRESLPFAVDCVFQGGPVRLQAMQVVHPYGESVPQSLPVMAGVWIGGDFEVLCQGFADGRFAPGRCRFCLGYAGWGSGQLADEFAQEAWLHASASVALIFDTPADRVWARAVRRCGERNGLFRHFPDDPSRN